MPDKCLLLLLDEVRAKTLRILNSVPAESARWAPPGFQNTTLWHAGHAYVLVEGLTMKSLERIPRYRMAGTRCSVWRAIQPWCHPTAGPHSPRSSTTSKPSTSGWESSSVN
jgi:hypothetical protein